MLSEKLVSILPRKKGVRVVFATQKTHNPNVENCLEDARYSLTQKMILVGCYSIAQDDMIDKTASHDQVVFDSFDHSFVPFRCKCLSQLSVCIDVWIVTFPVRLPLPVGTVYVSLLPTMLKS